MGKELLKRSEVPVETTWDISTIYKSLDDFDRDFQVIKENMSQLAALQGHLTESKDSFSKALHLRDDLLFKLGHLYTYAHLNLDVDTSNASSQELMAKTRDLENQFFATIAYFQPEFLSADKAIIESYLQAEDLKVYAFEFELLFRSKPYTLSDKEEAILAKSSVLYDSGANTFSVLNNADLKFPNVKDENGDEITLSHGRYSTFLESNNRTCRHDAFKAMYATYKNLENTFASTLSTNVKSHNLNALIRGYQSARHQALFNNTIDESVFEALLDAVHENLDGLHQYMALRKKALGLDDLRMYDLYVPMVNSVDLKFTFEEAKEITLEALSVLGDEYVDILKHAFEDRWIDQLENQGKRSGAYSSGTYGTNPFILLNWQGSLNDLYTLVHELGHSVHSYYSRKFQPFIYGNYSIFLAEIASTTNENLLTHYLLEKYKDDKEVVAYLINYFLDGVKGTIYRQTQFAEFEHLIHQADQNGQPLTANFMNDKYFELNQKYYGEALTYDQDIEGEWARIPHFYYNYYVYQYATGFSAAVLFSEMILTQGKPAVEKYINYLKSGWSDYPIEVLKRAGVDMSSNHATKVALELFKKRLSQLESLLLK